MWRKKYYENPRRLALAAIAKQTQEMTPTIAAGLPYLDVEKSEKLDLATLPPLDPAKCPRFRLASQDSLGTTTRVFNQDSFDAALSMPSSILNTPPPTLGKSATSTEKEKEILTHLEAISGFPANLNPLTAARVAVLNMASDRNPGGGWLKGASAQEEALCFRSTLAASLHRGYYPIRRREGVYTRDVVIFRDSASEGHKLMVPETPVGQLPVVSVLSVAGIRRPEVKPEAEEGREEENEVGTPGKEASAHQKHGKAKAKAPKGPVVFADPAARDLTKDKMRLCLRMAGSKGHTMLVLGALGCGAFRNPPQEVARCWQEVLREDEFAGGWFREIWFAVYDRRNEGNFEIFRDAFDGKIVGERKVANIEQI
ncbi:hypothetical protein C8A03DRAFT_46176 [Achaetomium macrosporum]|uniref:Microbial-type PARG catalytic domain-containing protein n=1 Tax=Achaetomium macrosporum TaxID=79813 RepID=A0AAN7H5C4_9PEZI|nr:hypothetical protein C8A03DRAFT_46176 [Achaetomium macrosporum]